MGTKLWFHFSGRVIGDFRWNSSDVDAKILTWIPKVHVINLHVISHVSDLYTRPRTSPRSMTPQLLLFPLFFPSFCPNSVALIPHPPPDSSRPPRPSRTPRIHVGSSLLEARTSTSGDQGAITCERETFSLHYGSGLGDKAAGRWSTNIW